MNVAEMALGKQFFTSTGMDSGDRREDHLGVHLETEPCPTGVIIWLVAEVT